MALLAQKSMDIKTDITQREERLKITDTQLKGILERLAKIEEEVQAVRDSAEKSGNLEKKHIEEAGENEARRILALTEEEIGNKMETAVRNLKERIADLTITHFKKDIAAHLDSPMHERLIEKNIAILSGDGIPRNKKRTGDLRGIIKAEPRIQSKHGDLPVLQAPEKRTTGDHLPGNKIQGKNLSFLSHPRGREPYAAAGYHPPTTGNAVA